MCVTDDVIVIDCILIVSAQLYEAVLALLNTWLLANSVQLQLSTVGAWSPYEYGLCLLVGSQRGGRF